MKVLVVVAAFVALCSSNVIPNKISGNSSGYTEGVKMPDNEGKPVLEDLQTPVDEAVLASRNKDLMEWYNYQYINVVGNDNHVENNIFNKNIAAHELNTIEEDINRIVRTACRATQGCNVFVVDRNTVVANSANTTAARDLPLRSPDYQYINDVGNNNKASNHVHNSGKVGHELNNNEEDLNRIVRTACRATQGNVFVVDRSTVVANSANTTAARDLPLRSPNEQHMQVIGNDNHVENYIFNTNIVVHELSNNGKNINRIVRTACRATQGCNVFVVDRSTVVANSANTTAARDLHLLGQNYQYINVVGNTNYVSNYIFNTNIVVHELNTKEENLNRIVRTACRATQGNDFVVDRSTVVANSAYTTAARDLPLRRQNYQYTNVVGNGNHIEKYLCCNNQHCSERIKQ